MKPSPKNTHHAPGFWLLLCNIRIRKLLFLVFGLLTLITIAALGWNAVQVYNQYDEAEQMAGSNAIGQQALALNALLASERGLTASLLANPGNYNVESRQYVQHLRENTDQGFRLLFQALDEYPNLSVVPSIYHDMVTIAQGLDENRLQVGRSLEHNEAAINYREWMVVMTQRIDQVAMINRRVMAPVREEDHAVRYGLFIKEAFFTFSENAGRERALISAVIAQERPFRQEEYLQLEIYQHTIQLIEERLNEVIAFFPETAELNAARTELQRAYKQDYLELRAAVIQSSRTGQQYPLPASQWFERATEAVNAILNLSRVINQHISEDIESIKARSRYTVLALFITLLLVVSVFIVAFMATYRRILMPLRELETSANTIAEGDFSQTIQVIAKDEFGEVADAFEVMRNYLFHDREQRQHAEQELRKLSTAIEQSVSSVIITDTQGITEYVNPQFHHTTGYAPEEIIGRKANLLRSGMTPVSTYVDLWETVAQGRVWQGELLNKKKNGELYWELVSISPVRNAEDEITHFIGIQHDISERKTLEERLNFMAYHDELTELPNRTLLADRFKQLVTQAERINNHVALMILDLDRFKIVNDSLGHRVGDQLLIEVAQRLEQAARGSDTTSRYGGDEFVILVNGFTHSEALIDLANRVLGVLAEPFSIEGHQLHVSASIGISIWPDDGENMDTLLRKADTAMYHAKDLGRGQFQFFTDELNVLTSQRLRMENDLREAIINQEFELYYQPQVQMGNGRIVGAEALIRWNHPELGQISPLQFIPLAEETNLIKPIGEWVLKTACAQAVQWKSAGYSELSMAVNVSARQLDEDSFISRLSAILAESGIEPSQLEIEITESSVMSQPEKMLEVLNKIKQLGVKLALDDFGTGYSSLSYLRRFPFDKLKIDRSFIIDITNKPEDAAIARAIGEMAHCLNMTVLAEGVETDLQASYMHSCACDQIQGYLISRPLPASEFERLLYPASMIGHTDNLES